MNDSGFKIFYFDGDPLNFENGYGEFVKLSDGGAYKLMYRAHNVMQSYRFMYINMPDFEMPPEYRYVRVTYMTGEGRPFRISFRDNGNAETKIIEENTLRSSGKFVRTNTIELTDSLMERFKNGRQQVLQFSSCFPNSELFVREIAYFTSEADSYEYYKDSAYVYPTGAPVLTVIRNSIDKYSVVIPCNCSDDVKNAAQTLVEGIKEACGILLPIKKDDQTPDDFEIIFDKAARAGISELYGENSPFLHKGYLGEGAIVRAIDNKLVFACDSHWSYKRLVEEFVNSNLINGLTIDLNKDTDFLICGVNLAEVKWPKVENVENPITEKVDLSAAVVGTRPCEVCEDEGGNSFTTIEKNGIKYLANRSNGSALMHLFERNVILRAKFSFDGFGDNGEFRFLLRDSIPRGGVWLVCNKCGWHVEMNAGPDFSNFTIASSAEKTEPGIEHTIEIKLDDSHITALLDGKKIIDSDKAYYIAPGRVGFSAENLSLCLRDIEVDLLSGQGRLMLNVEHTRLPDEEYREGGSVIILKDGSWQYRHHSGASFNSKDNGKTWQRTEKWSEIVGYCNVFRLASGKLITCGRKERDGVKYLITRTSDDDGKTWIDGGEVCRCIYPGTEKVFAGNMNDKFTQMSDGRIFYGQNYEGSFPGEASRRVFCEIYYSDDEGATWTKSETDTPHMKGNEGDPMFGECKVVKTAEGKLRVLCSWNKYPDVVYSESDDDGKTWGEIRHIEYLKCARSSLQFVRDVYADNGCTYFGILVFDELSCCPKIVGMPRTRLGLLHTTDGINWDYLGDVVRRESPLNGTLINHIVDPFINVTKDYVVVGSGIGEHMGQPNTPDGRYHKAQRQHIFSIKRDTLKKYEEFPTTK